jgi:hypothetical protein
MDTSLADSCVELQRSVEGIISQISAESKRPRGYPYRKITVYLVGKYKMLSKLENPHTAYEEKPADLLEDMLTLNFKIAGKIFGKNVQKAKELITTAERTEDGWKLLGVRLPTEAIVPRETIPVANEINRKTTPCRRALIETDGGDEEDHWLTLQFSKTVKKYITEDLRWNYLPEIFKAPRCFDEFGEEQDTLYVTVTFVDGSETLYQSLQLYGAFKGLPITLKLPDRETMLSLKHNHTVFGCKLLIERKLTNQPAYKNL